MKLLFDHNLSFRLIDKVPDQFKESYHVYQIGLGQAEDVAIWEYASKNDLTIITKDTDFFDLVSLRGFPPKVIWIKRGNCSTTEIATIVAENVNKIVAFIADEENGALIID